MWLMNLLEQENEIFRKRIYELSLELSTFVSQYGCTCGHPSCKHCEDTKDAIKCITNAK